MSSSSPGLILFDIRMLVMAGIELVKRINEDGYSIPVIFINACTDISDKMRGFALKAEDYICKPYDYQELLAHAQIAERHITRSNINRNLKVRPLELLSEALQVTINGDKVITLTPTEMQVMTLLMNNADKVVERDRFFNQLWQEETNKVLDVYIARLLRKLGKAGKNIACVRHCYRLKYSLPYWLVAFIVGVYYLI
ncbi:response regulator transcription factor [Ktedonospora formicarum]|uniref:DNA-binding response regulator n=1 Tax=Ktedonospora formicarum TaxID=2778364 RepID=A0A8J3MX07_9CHLR|nr:response regulator transcription factor [Ktedonospora formicarum]GHO49228.1 DNA-binding response regulator [Ktedonospora formicarum]